MSNASQQLVDQVLTENQPEDEIKQADKIAETLNALQGVIERNANELQNLDKTLKEKKEMLKNHLENNQEVSAAEAKIKTLNQELKQKKSHLNADPLLTKLKLEIAEYNQEKKEIEETLSQHLLNYHQLTGSTSFDTTDGDQWEFNIKAKVKPRKS